MNVLEKILEEIEDHAIEFESFGMCDDYVSVGWAKDIIRSHMGDVPKCRECSRRKFYMQGYEDGKKNDGWIPVEERLPNEEEFKEAYCRNKYAAEFVVMIEDATRPTTLYYKNGSWFDEERNYYSVVAWQPLPKPYKEG